ncbi:MAG: MCE family protein [Bryobacteraceae bacterium]|nr:MCE family protein [Bryobacteraceae bacterium]
MPSAKKIRWSQLKVGIMAILALSVLGFLVFLMTGERRFFAQRALLYTYLDDSYAITQGSPVRLNGILIGKISNVGLSGDSRPNRTIKVEMDVDIEMLPSIPTDSVATIASENVLGSKYINIKRGKASAHISPGGEIGAQDISGFEDVVASGYEVMTALRGLITRMDAIIGQVEAGEGSIGKLLTDEKLYNHLTATVAEAQKVTEALNRGQGTLGRLFYDETLYDETRSTVARMDQILEDVQSGQGTVGRFLKDPALYNEMRGVIADARKLLDDLNAGKGTAGKLLKDDELHREIVSVTKRLDGLLERINTGEGTLGQLVVNPQLFESLNGATREMHELMKDFRANPKKFLRIKLAIF